MKTLFRITWLLLIACGFGCSSDDDGGSNPTPTSIFLPVEITASDGDTQTVFLSYNENNQLESFRGSGAVYEFGYNDQGLIYQVDDFVVNNRISIEYDGNIITTVTNLTTSTDIPVSFTGGQYNVGDSEIVLNSQNQLINWQGIPITYANNEGPFNTLSFQPVLLLLDSIDVFVAYFFAPNEISQITVEGTLFNLATERNEGGQIIRVGAIPEGATDEAFHFTFTYEERPLNP